MGERLLTSEERSGRKIVISSKLQEGDSDCVQTVLDMLGYNGHRTYPGREISLSELLDIPGAEEIIPLVGRQRKFDYSYPRVLIITWKHEPQVDEVTGACHFILSGDAHCVIRHEDRVYCPAIGEMDAEEYEKKYKGQ